MLPEIKVNIGVDTDSLQKGLTDATNKLARFGKQAGAAIAVAGTGAAVGLAALTKAAIDNADALDNMSQRVGVSVEALSRLQYAAKLSDTSIESLQTGFRTLANNMVAGSDAFAKLGISITNADGSMRSSVDIFSEIADRFAGMEDGALKSALAVDFFGRSGLDLIPMLNAGSAGIAEFNRQSDQVGYTLSTQAASGAAQFNDTLDRIGLTMNGVVNKVMVAALPALQSLADTLASPEFAAAAGTLASNVINALNAILVVTEKVTNAIDQIFGGPSKLSTSQLKKDIEEYQAMLGSGEWLFDRDAVVKKVEDLKSELLARPQKVVESTFDTLGGATTFGSTDEMFKSLNPPSKVGGGLGTGLGGGGSPAIDAERERIQARLDVIREGFLTETEMLTQKYEDDQQLLNDALAKKLMTEQEHKNAVEGLEKEHQDKLKAIRSAEMYRNLDAVASIGNSIVSIMKSTGNKQIGIQKGIASAAVGISTAAGVMKAFEQYGWPNGLLPAAAVAAEGMAQLASINSASASGSNGAGGVRGGGSAAAAEPAMNRTLTVQGITPGQIFSGDAMRDFMEQMLQMQRDGYQVVLA